MSCTRTNFRCYEMTYVLDLNVVIDWLHGGELFELTTCHVPKFVANLDCLISKYGVSLKWV